jgi:hypothetical protein
VPVMCPSCARGLNVEVGFLLCGGFFQVA